MTKRYQPDMVQKGWEDVFVAMQLESLPPKAIKTLRKIFFSGAAFAVLSGVSKKHILTECFPEITDDV